MQWEGGESSLGGRQQAAGGRRRGRLRASATLQARVHRRWLLRAQRTVLKSASKTLPMSSMTGRLLNGHDARRRALPFSVRSTLQ